MTAEALQICSGCDYQPSSYFKDCPQCTSPMVDRVYPYGETPEEVIRERLETIDIEHEKALAVAAFDADNPATEAWLDAVSITHGARNAPDALLTVLDALHLSHEAFAPADNTKFSRLRIEILAALGITEA